VAQQLALDEVRDMASGNAAAWLQECVSITKNHRGTASTLARDSIGFLHY